MYLCNLNYTAIKAMKKSYIAPSVMRQTDVCLESAMLVASVVNKVTTIESKGQEVVQYNFDSPGNTFNHTWEN